MPGIINLASLALSREPLRPACALRIAAAFRACFQAAAIRHGPKQRRSAPRPFRFNWTEGEPLCEPAYRRLLQEVIFQAMDSSIDLVAIATALGTAVYAALGLDYITLYEFGLPLQAVCKGAVLVALLIGVYVAIEFVSGKLTKG